MEKEKECLICLLPQQTTPSKVDNMTFNQKERIFESICNVFSIDLHWQLGHPSCKWNFATEPLPFCDNCLKIACKVERLLLDIKKVEDKIQNELKPFKENILKHKVMSRPSRFKKNDSAGSTETVTSSETAVTVTTVTVTSERFTVFRKQAESCINEEQRNGFLMTPTRAIKQETVNDDDDLSVASESDRTDELSLTSEEVTSPEQSQLDEILIGTPSDLQNCSDELSLTAEEVPSPGPSHRNEVVVVGTPSDSQKCSENVSTSVPISGDVAFQEDNMSVALAPQDDFDAYHILTPEIRDLLGVIKPRTLQWQKVDHENPHERSFEGVKVKVLPQYWECSYCQYKVKSGRKSSEKKRMAYHIKRNHLGIKTKKPPKSCITERKPLQCPLCDKRYFKKKAMDNHTNAVHSTKSASKRNPFVCDYDYCAKPFNRKQNLERHKELVHKSKEEVKIHGCPHCKKTYSKVRLSQHIKEVHQKDRVGQMVECKHCKLIVSKGRLKKHVQLKH